MRRGRRQTTSKPSKVDAFGTVRLLGAEYRARVIDLGDSRLAILRASDDGGIQGTTLQTTSDIELRGRIMRTTIEAEGGETELQFQRAGCGCETPRQLRGNRARLIEAAQ